MSDVIAETFTSFELSLSSMMIQGKRARSDSSASLELEMPASNKRAKPT